jgi:peptide/nickel transport system substrate-binding protein
MRLVVVLSLLACLVFPVAAEGGKEAPGAKAGTPAAVKGAKEAPALAQLVKAGKLPPLEQRLPKNPLVVKPVEKVGQYGGTWRYAHVGTHLQEITRPVGYEPLVRWSPGWSDVVPGVAESWTVSPDAKVYTFKLREGMKWSDGQPFTADDVLFVYEDIIMNDKLTPTKPRWVRDGGKVEKVDALTVRVTLGQPDGLYLLNLAGEPEPQYTMNPKHYLSKFMPKYNPKADEEAKAAGFSDWVTWIDSKRQGPANMSSYWSNPDMPSLHAWIFTTPPGKGVTRAVAERNPYYWKVDTEGKQLPYMDRVTIDIFNDVESLVLKVSNGEIDMMDQFFALPANKPVIFDNQKRGDYHFYKTIPTFPNTAVIDFNFNHKDPVKREVFRDKNFRIGMSYAINRKEIIDLVYLGEGEPHQAAPLPGTPFYNEKLAKQYTEYNPELAAKYLDQAGLDKKDAQGFRLGPDGKPFVLVFHVMNFHIDIPDATQLIAKHWNKVGVKTEVRVSERNLWEEQVRQQVDFDVTMHKFGGGYGMAIVLDPRYYFPFNGNSMYAPAWQLWWNNPSGTGSKYKPEEPPEYVKKQQAMYDEIRKTGDSAKQMQLMKDILAIAQEQFYVIGISTDPPGYGVVKNNMKNVPASMPWSWIYPHPAPDNPCQFFFEKK